MSTNRHPIPATWVWARLPEVAENLDHRRVPVNAKERSKRLGHVPYYGATGQVGWIDDFLFDEPLVLLGEDGAPFLESGKPKAYFIEGKSWVNNHAHVLRAMEGGLAVRYLMHVLNTLDYHDAVTGTTRLKLTQAAMNRLVIPLAPLAEQYRIVAEIEKHFTRLDAAVASLQRARANLKRYRASVLKAACEGRLVATEAELARREGRDYEPSPLLLERILKDRRARWEAQGRRRGTYKEPQPPDTSNLPPLPDGWVWATTKQISESSLGKMLDQKRTAGQPLPYLRNINVRWNGFDLSDLLEMPFKQDELDRYSLLPGDVLVCEGGEPGRSGVWPGNSQEIKYQKALHRVRLYGGITPRWVVFSLWNDANTGRLAKYFTGTTIKHFTGVSFERYPLPLPPLAEQQRIVAEVERHMSVIQAAENVVDANLKRAERMRQAILKRAFEGKLVPQDPSDEPASVLLERIRKEREQTERNISGMRHRTERRGKPQEASA
jgi:type I restriction enzyme S subunit